MVRELEDQDARSGWLGLTEKRLAFEDALGVSNSTVEGMDDEKPRLSAHALADSVCQNPHIDWTRQESGPANPCRLVNRLLLLNMDGYPPDL